jgi:hypothetical protein
MDSLVTTASPITALWLAVAGRLAYFTHLASGHAVTWRRSAPDPTICPGDIVCEECGQVLWCRAHDPWRTARPDLIPDHWGATRPRHLTWTLFESFERVLQLADECPRGPAGDAVRRAACELVEADSMRQRRVRRRRMLQAVARLERWQAHQPGQADDPGMLALKRLTTALRDQL